MALATLGNGRKFGLHRGEGSSEGNLRPLRDHALLHQHQALHLVDLDRRVTSGALNHADDGGVALRLLGRDGAD